MYVGRLFKDTQIRLADGAEPRTGCVDKAESTWRSALKCTNCMQEITTLAAATDATAAKECPSGAQLRKWCWC